MPATARRISTTVTPELDEAVQAAERAHLVGPSAGEAERLRAWALYGFRAWRSEQVRDDKLAAYRELAGDQERRDDLRAANLRAAGAGLL